MVIVSIRCHRTFWVRVFGEIRKETGMRALTVHTVHVTSGEDRVACVLGGRGPKLTLAASLPQPHIPGSVYTGTFTPKAPKSVAILPLYSWSFGTVVHPGCPSGEPTQTSLSLWAAPQACCSNWSPAPCPPAPSPLHSCGSKTPSSGVVLREVGGQGAESMPACPPVCRGQLTALLGEGLANPPRGHMGADAGLCQWPGWGFPYCWPRA